MQKVSHKKIAYLKKVVFTGVVGVVYLALLTGCMKPENATLKDVERTNNQERLTEIASSAKDTSARLAAVDKISDQELLEKVANYASYLDASFAGIDKITDQEILGSVAQYTINEDVCLYAVDKITDEKILAEIASADYSSFKMKVQRAAINKITDQKLLEVVFSNIQDLAFEDVPDVAFAKATGKETRVYSRLPDYQLDLSHAVLLKMTDQEVLENIVYTIRNSDTKLVAIKNINDLEKLAKIALNSDTPECRRAAVEQLSEQKSRYSIEKINTALATIAVESQDDSICSSILVNLVDTEAFSLLPKLETDTQLLRANAFKHLITGFTGVPSEHRIRHIKPLLLIIDEIFCRPDVMQILGQIVKIEATWSPASKPYGMIGIDETHRMQGEGFGCKFIFANLNHPIITRWGTEFSEKVELQYVPSGKDLGFKAATPEPIAAIPDELFNLLPEDVLAKIAIETNYKGLAEVLIKEIFSGKLLAKIAIETDNVDIGKAAIKKLPLMYKKDLRKKIASEAKNEQIREAASGTS